MARKTLVDDETRGRRNTERLANPDLRRQVVREIQQQDLAQRASRERCQPSLDVAGGGNRDVPNNIVSLAALCHERAAQPLNADNPIGWKPLPQL
jgi:hypothetical protein